MNDMINLEPSVILKSTDAASTQFDINLRALYDNKLWFGMSYRDQDALVLMTGVNYQDYSIGYSYDKVLSDISDYTQGSWIFY